ncbi:MAG: hypothetical protein ABEJ87_00130 [Candidatus Nanohalobium sp.]
MSDDLDYEIRDILRTDEGKITSMDVFYETSQEQDVAQITHGSARGVSTIDNEYGDDDLVYTVKPENLQETRRQEVLVPETVAHGSPENFADNVLSKYAETDESEEWAMEGLEGI